MNRFLLGLFAFFGVLLIVSFFVMMYWGYDSPVFETALLIAAFSIPCIGCIVVALGITARKDSSHRDSNEFFVSYILDSTVITDVLTEAEYVELQKDMDTDSSGRYRNFRSELYDPVKHDAIVYPISF